MFGISKTKAKIVFTRAFETGDFGAAIKVYRKLAKQDPDDYESVHDLGYLFLSSNQGAEAIECFVKANTICEHPYHWNNLGSAYMLIKDFSKAREAYAKAMQLDANDPSPWFNLTTCLREMGKAEESMSQLTGLLKKHPSHAGANNDRALYFEEQGDVDKAIKRLAMSLRHNPDYEPSRLNLIRMLCERGDYPASTPHLEYLASQGHQVVVSADDGQASVVIDGTALFEGPIEL